MTAPPESGLLRWLSRLLRNRLGDVEAESFIGDLVEEAGEVAVRHGAAAARFWLWRQSLVAIVTLPHCRRPMPATEPIGDPRMLIFLADLRHGARLLRRAPAFTILATLTIALGIGATTAIFSVADPVLFRPLPYPHAEQLVLVGERDGDGTLSNLGYLTYADVASEARTLEHAAAAGDWQVTLDDRGAPERVSGQRVSAGFFAMLGVRPALGRDFTAGEDNPNDNAVVMLSHGLWTRRYGADSALVGRTISINGKPFLLAGVLPPDFESVISPQAQIWRVLGYDASLPYACRTCRHLRMYARLREGVPLTRAGTELNEISTRLARVYPKEYPATGMLVRPLADATLGNSRPALWAVLGAALLVLLITAANVANLQIARAMRRDEEFAIRAALGAGRSRLALQLLAEGMLLAVIGGAAGLAVARTTLAVLVAQLPATMPRLSAIALDRVALGVGAALTLLLGCIIGLLPALRDRRSALSDALRGGRRLTGGRHLARSGLVVSEVALALMLLMGAGLLARSLMGLMAVDPGFDPTGLLTLEAQAVGPKYPDSVTVLANHEQIVRTLSALPGVEAVGTASQLPLGGNMDKYGVNAQDKPLANPELAPYADRYSVSPRYLSAMRIPLREGRTFVDGDNNERSSPVAIVSAGLAARVWPGESAVGKRIRVGGANAPWRTVIGVVGNIHHRALDVTESFQFYVPERQWLFADNSIAVVVRTKGDPATVARAVRAAVQEVDRGQPITKLETMSRVIAMSTAQRRLALTLFATFAGLALVLAVAGIYGVMAGMVTERTREIGVRNALGATPSAILAMVLIQGGRLTGIGLAVGVAGAVMLGHFLQSLLYGVGATDPLTLFGVALLLSFVAFAACLLPAVRAVGIDPMTALRAD